MLPRIVNDVSTYILFENPLHMRDYGNDLRDSPYKRSNGIADVTGRHVLQNEFCLYLRKCIILKRYIPTVILSRVSK